MNTKHQSINETVACQEPTTQFASHSRSAHCLGTVRSAAGSDVHNHAPPPHLNGNKQYMHAERWPKIVSQYRSAHRLSIALSGLSECVAGDPSPSSMPLYSDSHPPVELRCSTRRPSLSACFSRYGKTTASCAGVRCFSFGIGGTFWRCGRGRVSRHEIARFSPRECCETCQCKCVF